MSEDRPISRKRERLDPTARDRLLAEIARLETGKEPEPVPGPPARIDGISQERADPAEAALAAAPRGAGPGSPGKPGAQLIRSDDKLSSALARREGAATAPAPVSPIIEATFVDDGPVRQAPSRPSPPQQGRTEPALGRPVNKARPDAATDGTAVRMPAGRSTTPIGDQGAPRQPAKQAMPTRAAFAPEPVIRAQTEASTPPPPLVLPVALSAASPGNIMAPQDRPDSPLVAPTAVLSPVAAVSETRQHNDKPSAPPTLQHAVSTMDAWAALGLVALDEAVLDRSLVITAARRDPAHGAFDVLRTRLLGALAEHGWNRVGVTSPTKGCGKSFTALNLAVALSRYDGRRTLLMDMDMRVPSLARSLGMSTPGCLGDVLRGLTPASAHLRRVAPNRQHIGHLALALNGQPEAFAAELFQEPRTAEVLAGIQVAYRPDVILYDLPPALAQDDVIAFRPHLDCILMVVGGGMTSAREVRESIRRLGEEKPVVGIVLNRAEGQGVGEYAY